MRCSYQAADLSCQPSKVSLPQSPESRIQFFGIKIVPAAPVALVHSCHWRCRLYRSHACKALAARGYEPISYDNLSRGNRWAVRWGRSQWARWPIKSAYADVIQVAQRVSAKAIQVEIAARRPGDPPVLVGAANRAHAVLG